MFLDRVDPAKQVHIGRYPPKTDPSMAADFVLDMTRTDDRGVCLYRGMVITARILDLVQAPPGTPLSHMVSAAI